jgi:hypothetical protein
VDGIGRPGRSHQPHPHRHPGDPCHLPPPVALAKAALTVDHISAGRLELGMGPGGSPADHRIVGEPLWPPAERVGRFAEAVQIVDGILRRQLETFDGRYYRVDRPSLEPPPVQQPRPPLTLGVQGPRTLRLAAAYADAWSTFGGRDVGPGLAGNLARSVEEALAVTRRRNELPDAYCAQLGRDPTEITRSFVNGCTPDDPWASAQAFADFVGRYQEVGINELILEYPPMTDIRGAAGLLARLAAQSRNKPGGRHVAPAEGCTRNHSCHNRWQRPGMNEGLEVTMPAVTAETLALPRLPHPGPEQVDRPVVSVTTAPSGLEGEGFPVRRAFAGVDLPTLDPFVHMDQMGEVDYAPGEPKGTPWHPHRGFETVTYMIDGIFQHQDSNGGGGLITDGDTQWMTAGAELSFRQRQSCRWPARMVG